MACLSRRMASSRSSTEDSTRLRTSALGVRDRAPCSFSPAAKIRWMTLPWSSAARRSLSSTILNSASCCSSRTVACWDRRIRSRRPWVATASSPPSAAHSRARRIVTASGADWTTETTISAATIAATTQADSHGRWNRALQMSGISSTRPTPETVPPPRVRASAHPVQVRGTSTDAQAGSRR